jgi:flagellar hook-length control protein FliK
LSQALPVLPQPPVLDGRKPELRPSDHAGQRQSFGKLLDRFTQRDVAKDTAKEPTREPVPGKRAEAAAESDASREDGEEPTSCESAAKTDPEAVHAPEVAVVAPAVVPTPVDAPAIAATATEPLTTVLVILPVEAPVQTAEASIVAAAAPSIPQPQVPAAETPTTAGDAAPTLAPVGAEAIAAAPQPTAADTIARIVPTDRAAVPLVPAPMARVAAAAANPAGKPTGTKAEPTSTTPSADAALMREPIAQATAAPVEAADLTPPVRENGKAKATLSAVLADPLAAAAIRDEKAGKTPEQQFGALLAVDTPRSAAAQYHKVAETVRTAAAETPSPADQVSIRLLHAVAEGKRTIQMHLHPAELGTIDVKMQWQGDRLTAQFQVDRPETLQLLQREVPALERTLNQAGVNVDSGSLSFSLRQQTGNGQNGSGQPFDPAAAGTAFGDAADLPLGDEPLGQVIRDGILSIRV